ncbi:dihydroxy-acid dehydratase [Geosmithia morbida]|uniref:Dihydroxy-acid dehydratase n=1 Tax=Geosmithia morbida TaxID=1094350 RepID=A0A9P4YR38_9HYPO|nr:dihydroxy-acid dehydratase [Geosmithia morbida]KAF4121215.1 dihydroxy-acid dehydratase [Geosmithia morbida]
MVGCANSCADCSCKSDQAKQPGDIEDYFSKLSEAQDRIAELERKIRDLGGKTDHDASPPKSPVKKKAKTLRSTGWFNDTSSPVLTSIYLERYQNYGLTLKELMSGKPIIGIAQTGSDLAPCNRHHIELAKRVRDGIRTAGAIAFEFPTHPIQETGRRPSPTIDRNLAYLGLVELLHGYPIDGVVLLTGCDKTTPACIMAAATLNIPSICMNVGPMLNGHDGDQKLGSGMVIWKADQLFATGKINFEEMVHMVSLGAPSVGHCNTMGTASTMNALAEALGMALPGSSAIPAAYKERGQCAYETGVQIVEMVKNDRKPSEILTRKAFENAIRVNAAIGGSTNAPIHLNAIAKHIGLELNNDDWYEVGFNIPLLLNMQPAGEYLGEDYYQAGGAPAIMAQLLEAGHLWADALTVNGKTVGENVRGTVNKLPNVIRPFADPLKPSAGFINLSGSLFDSAILKTSTISPYFQKQFLSNPESPNAFEGKSFVFDGPEDFRANIDDPALGIDDKSILVMRGCGPIGFPGAGETVNMRPPNYLIDAGCEGLPCIGDGRQSGTSASPSILNASPEAAAGGNLALLRHGDVIRVDLNTRRVDLLLSDEEIKDRREKLDAQGGYKYPESQTPWQELYRAETGQLDEGMVLKRAVKYLNVAERCPVPRHSH